MHPRDPQSKDQSGICWSCLGIDLTLLYQPESTLGYNERHEMRLDICIRWSNVNQECTNCLNIQALLQPHTSIISQRDLQASQAQVIIDYGFIYKAGGCQLFSLVYNLAMGASLQQLYLTPCNGSRTRTELPDLMKIRERIHHCLTDHPAHCAELPRRRDFPLTVIDCVNRILCEISPEAQTPYVCLSYLWGKNISATKTDDHDLHSLPRTIEDALSVAKDLAIPYLWVDRYCIDQSNIAEKHRLIQSMDIIYQGATLTIIAASGDNPTTGLPGINGTPRPSSDSNVFRVQGYDAPLIGLLDPQVEMTNSHWATRGWTFQEMMLSRRRLIFTHSQMYYQCGYEHVIEDLDEKNTDSLLSCRQYDPACRKYRHKNLHLPSDVSTIWKRIREYYPRAVTFKEDIIAAFEGIYGPFRGQGHVPNHFYGLLGFKSSSITTPNTPLLSFLSSMTWWLDYFYPEAGPPLYRSSIFPSWSWAHSMGNQRVEIGRLHLAPSLYICYVNSSDCSVTIEQCSGRRIGLDAFVTESLDYRHFHPWLDLEAWMAPGTLVPPLENHRVADISVLTEPGVNYAFKNDYTLPPMGTEILVVYVGYNVAGWIYLLVMQEPHGSGYRRLGLYRRFYPEGQTPHSDACENPAQKASPGSWERRTIRLV